MLKPAQLPARHPIKFHRAQIGVGQLLEEVDGFRALDRDLREIVGEILDRTVELARIVANPAEVFFARARVDHQKVFVFAQAVNDDIVDERSFGIEKCGVLSLSDRQLRGVVHRNVLDGGKSLWPGEADVAHVADVENADACTHRHVLIDDAAADRCRVLDWHVPAVELHHLCIHLAMDSVERGFADGGRLDRRQNRPQNEQWLAAGMV